MLVYPLQKLSLVFQSIVQTQGLVRDDLLASQEPVWSHPVVEVDYHNAFPRGANNFSPVKVGVAIVVETATLDEDVDR